MSASLDFLCKHAQVSCDASAMPARRVSQACLGPSVCAGVWCCKASARRLAKDCLSVSPGTLQDSMLDERVLSLQLRPEQVERKLTTDGKDFVM